jgi:hypothetical protein
MAQIEQLGLAEFHIRESSVRDALAVDVKLLKRAIGMFWQRNRQEKVEC